MMPKVAVLVGSLRKASHNRKLAFALAKLAASKLELSQVPLDDLPMFNEDLFTPAPPAPVDRFKQALREADAFLILTPEYNRMTTPIIKNAIDWGSRPWGQNSWADKPGAIAGVSLGNIGSAVAQASLRTSLIALDVTLMGQPEIYLTYKDDLIDADNNVADERVRALLTRFIDRFATWIAKNE